MKKRSSRTPRNYSGTGSTNHKFNEVLAGVLSHIREHRRESPDMVLDAWPEVIGPMHSRMTRATSFVEGVLTVKVTNSTSRTLLECYEKARILTVLRQMFPKINIQNIVFRIG